MAAGWQMADPQRGVLKPGPTRKAARQPGELVLGEVGNFFFFPTLDLGPTEGSTSLQIPHAIVSCVG